MMKTDLTRRAFLQKGSMVIAVTALPGQLFAFNVTSAKADPLETFHPHAFIEIAQNDTVTVWIGQTNLGQGTHTGIAMIVAEELDADWQRVQAKMALAAEPFKDPVWHAQITGGSTSIRHRWDIIRKAGAAARLMLLEAAALQWDIKCSKCRTENGMVIHPDGRKLSYGQLVSRAAKLPVPENPPLKDAKDYGIIGTAINRLDIPDKVHGRTVYGIDIQIPEMCIAVIARPPRFGSQPDTVDTDATMAVQGVLKVITLDAGIAVCATSTYAALQGREKLNIQWSPGSHPQLDDASLALMFNEAMTQLGALAEATGDAPKALADAVVKLSASYALPYVAHATLEPINCTAHVEKDLCRIWIPTQGQTQAQLTAAAITGLPLEKVEVMTTPAGGGFGLRGEVDPVIDAVTLSKAMGRPVKVMWTREDDFAHDYFRPGSVCRIDGGLDNQGRLIAWSQKIAAPSIMTRSMPQYVQNGIDPTSIQGIPDMPYTLPNRQVEYVLMDLPIRTGYWRSVGYSITTYTVETFMDDLAHAAGKDPVKFRLEHMEKDSRPYRTLSLLAEKSGWDSTVPAGRARGIALGTCFGSAAAHMAEVSVDTTTGQVTVHKVVCAIDCGPAVYPDAITAQLEGATVMALSLAFHERVHFSRGGVKTRNFDEYQLLTMPEVPEVEVHIAQSIHAIGGVGEPGIPTVAPAVANAISKATGVRLRELPFNRKKLMKLVG
jgi:isoquinoline 1-oxidoreductase beta subunit